MARNPKWLKKVTTYPIRQCIWVHKCAICEKDIVSGNLYYDGGYSRRVHIECAELYKQGDKI